MRDRCLAAFGVSVGLCALAGGLCVDTAAQGAQGANASSSSQWTAPKTPWGHPDLQGVWTTDLEIGVPLERPVELGEKALLSEAEYRQRAESLKKKFSDNKTDRTREARNEQGPVHWYEGAQHVSYRTSICGRSPRAETPGGGDDRARHRSGRRWHTGTAAGRPERARGSPPVCPLPKRGRRAYNGLRRRCAC